MLTEMLKQMRADSGLTQGEMAEKLGTDQVTVWRWESGKNEIKLSVFFRWCDVCGYNVVVTKQGWVPTEGL